jgi:hypothetical protein
MMMIRTTSLILAAISCVSTGLCSASSSVAADSVRTTTPSTVVMTLPADLGPMQRPLVEFNHEAHATAYEAEGCETCHARDDRQRLRPGLAATAGIGDRDGLISAYHDTCIRCHEQRSASSLSSGPVTCGECHVKRPPAVSARAPMAWDYSLHARHVQAETDRCESCHHVWDEAAQRLRYEKGAEEACRNCHGAIDVERNLSLANASHVSCISCHLERVGGVRDPGPILCRGCHDAQQQALIARLEDVPRLERGQPNVGWVHHEAGKFPAVAFDHLGHEGQTSFCSDCHHHSLQGCDTCHSLTGAVEGAGVTLAQSYHDHASQLSCVGCHATATEARSCAGCHSVLGASPAESTCATCHTGPATADAVAAAPAMLPEHELDPLPPNSDGYPETVVIDALVDEYQASVLPHAKIVRALDGPVRDSALAARFHGDTATLCSGCHHHSPVGVRPPACRSCHSESADPISDRPGLKVAYHRQCVGCHVAMAVEQQGCTDCHALKEVQQ